jgi:hypothetical protein
MFGVFLAYYLANDHFPGATPLQFAFVGGLSFSIGSYTTTVLLISENISNTFQLLSYLHCPQYYTIK